MWSILQARVWERNPKTFNQVTDYCKEEWKKIPLQYIQNIIDLLPSYIQKIIEVKGANIITKTSKLTLADIKRLDCK